MPSFKLIPVPYTILHPFDAPCHPTSSRSRLPLKQSRSSFTATSANSTIALYFRRAHSATLLTLMFHPPTRANLLWRPHSASCLRGGWAYALTPASHSPVFQRPHLPPKQSRSSYMLTSASQTIAILFHGGFCSSFTATSASQTTAQLIAVALTSQTIAQFFAAPTHPPNSRSLICPRTHSHRSSPRPVIHLTRTSASHTIPPLFQCHNCLQTQSRC